VTIRVLVTGGRDYPNREAVRRMLTFIAALFPQAAAGDFVLVHGDCKYRRKGKVDFNRSADQLAAQVAKGLGWQVEAHPVTQDDYARLGRSRAPRERNERMVSLGAAVCAAFPGGGGTRHCRETARAAGIRVITLSEIN